MLTGQMTDRPRVTWSGARAGELYTIMILDEVRRSIHICIHHPLNNSGHQLSEW